MATDVAVLDDGRLQLTVDGVTYPPLPLSAIQAAYGRIGDAQNVAQRQVMTASVRALTDVLIQGGATLSASVTITPSSLDATVDPDTFARVQAALGVQPNSDGTITDGAITVRQPVPPDPPPDPPLDPPPPDPTPTPDPGV